IDRSVDREHVSCITGQDPRDTANELRKGRRVRLGTEAHFAVMLLSGIALGSCIKPRNLLTVPAKTARLLVLSRLLIGMTGAVIVGHLAWGLEWYSIPGDWREVASSLSGSALLLYAYCRTVRPFKEPLAQAQMVHFPMQKRRKIASSTS